jgi:ATP-binding cassette subfamily F protein uup
MLYLFSCKSLAKAFGAQTLFSDISLVIRSGDKIGLIGPNGSGKSTLLKIICGIEDEDAGQILKQKHLAVSYLAQEDQFEDHLSCKENLLQAMTAMVLGEDEKVRRVEAILSRAELYTPDVAVQHLSGGWRKRLSICRALVVEPDLLVMDEPTNHLDIEGIIWLERLLNGTFSVTPTAFILVSHDRRFLENSVNRVIELSRVYPTGSFEVAGSYSDFLERRHLFFDEQNQLEERLTNKVKTETEWLRRGPKARTTKARYRVGEAYRLQDELGRVRQRNRASGSVSIDFAATGRKTKKLLEAKKIGKGYGDKPLFSDIDMTLSPGSRLGLVGRNGCGKSTLMQLLASAVDQRNRPDGGTFYTAPGLKIVSFSQNRLGLDQTLTLKRALAPEGDAVNFQGRSLHVVSWAKRFLFKPDQLETPVAQLSGGEQARILIADLMRQPADVLLLDEPTNDLDIGSLDVLEESLMDFGGALVLVTHDRYLLDRVCDRLLGFLGNGEAFYYADYQQWLRDLETRTAEGRTHGELRAKKTKGLTQKKRVRLTYLEQQEYEEIEERILEAEAERDRLEKRVNAPEMASEPLKLGKSWAEFEDACQYVDSLYTRWTELEEKKNQAG